jgi:hypothetical protein
MPRSQIAGPHSNDKPTTDNDHGPADDQDDGTSDVGLAHMADCRIWPGIPDKLGSAVSVHVAHRNARGLYRFSYRPALGALDRSTALAHLIRT